MAGMKVKFLPIPVIVLIAAGAFILYRVLGFVDCTYTSILREHFDCLAGPHPRLAETITALAMAVYAFMEMLRRGIHVGNVLPRVNPLPIYPYPPLPGPVAPPPPPPAKEPR